MSVEALRWAWSLSIPPSPKQVLVALADYANERCECWPSLDRLALKASRCKSTIIDAIAALVESRLISRIGRRGRAVAYRLHVGAQPTSKVRLRRHVASGEGSPPANVKFALGDFQGSPPANSSVSSLLIPEPPSEPPVKKRRTHEDSNQLRLRWPEVIKRIEPRVDPQRFRTWFVPIQPVVIRDDSLTLAVPNDYFREWLSEYGGDVILESVRAAGMDVRRLKFQTGSA